MTTNSDDDDNFDAEIDDSGDSDTGANDDDDNTSTDDVVKALRAELEAARASNARMEASLARANREAARRRLAAKKKDADSDSDSSGQVAEELNKWRARSIRAEARGVLAESGAKPERLSSLLRMLDIDALEYDGDDLVGLQEQISDLRDQVPELFTQDSQEDESPRPRRRTVRIDAGNRRPAGGSQDTTDATTLQVRALRSGKL